MKRLQTMIVLTCLILLSGALVKAQGGSSPSVPKRKFKHNAEIDSVYEKSKDHTTVIMQWYQVMNEDADKLRASNNYLPYIAIKAAFGYPGRLLKTTAAAVDFNIRTEYEGRSLFKGKEMPELVAVVDGERISLGKVTLEISKTSTSITSPWQTTRELLSATFTHEGLLRLTNAKNVTMKIGPLEFKLQEGHLEALRDLSSRMVPQ